MATQFHIERLIRNVDAMKRKLPIMLANQAQNYFSQSFIEQGWEGRSWQQVKRREDGEAAYKYPKGKDLGRRTRPILVGGLKKTGQPHLRNQVANLVRTGAVVTFPLIRLVLDSPYAARHNEGLDGMPKRTFMKDSLTLRVKQKELIEKFSQSVWQV